MVQEYTRYAPCHNERPADSVAAVFCEFYSWLLQASDLRYAALKPLRIKIML